MAIAFWSEQSYPGTNNPSRNSWAVEIKTRAEMEAAISKFKGAPNMVWFEATADEEAEEWTEGRDWTRRERELKLPDGRSVLKDAPDLNSPPCVNELLASFD